LPVKGKREREKSQVLAPIKERFGRHLLTPRYVTYEPSTRATLSANTNYRPHPPCHAAPANRSGRPIAARSSKLIRPRTGTSVLEGYARVTCHATYSACRTRCGGHERAHGYQGARSPQPLDRSQRAPLIRRVTLDRREMLTTASTASDTGGQAFDDAGAGNAGPPATGAPTCLKSRRHGLAQAQRQGCWQLEPHLIQGLPQTGPMNHWHKPAAPRAVAVDATHTISI